MPGPVPQREDKLAESRRPGRGGVTKGTMRPAAIPDPDLEWHPIALQLYEALRDSGQSDFFQSSDWAFAFSLCDDLSYYKNGTKRSGQMLQSIMSAMERLLVTEADRRRMRIELHEPKPVGVPASVTAINTYKQELGLDD